jgi:hypothetical protein
MLPCSQSGLASARVTSPVVPRAAVGDDAAKAIRAAQATTSVEDGRSSRIRLIGPSNVTSPSLTGFGVLAPRRGFFRAPPAGLEPATRCLEGSCSVRLSYGGRARRLALTPRGRAPKGEGWIGAAGFEPAKPLRPKRSALTRLSYAPCLESVRRAWQLAQTSSHLAISARSRARLCRRTRFPRQSSFSAPGRWSHCIAAGARTTPQSEQGLPAFSDTYQARKSLVFRFFCRWRRSRFRRQ